VLELEVRKDPPSMLRNVDGGPLGGAGVGGPEVGDIDGGPLGGCWQKVWQRPPPKLETSMVDPWGVMAEGPAAATTEVGDIDGGPLGGYGGRSASGHYQSWRRRWGPPGGVGGRSTSGHHRSWRRRWWAP
jgi:hypothetical protein